MQAVVAMAFPHMVRVLLDSVTNKILYYVTDISELLSCSSE